MSCRHMKVVLVKGAVCLVHIAKAHFGINGC